MLTDIRPEEGRPVGVVRSDISTGVGPK
jgi:hypothetical protein